MCGKENAKLRPGTVRYMLYIMRWLPLCVCAYKFGKCLAKRGMIYDAQAHKCNADDLIISVALQPAYMEIISYVIAYQRACVNSLSEIGKKDGQFQA